MDSDKYRIFISHSSKDAQLIELIRLTFANRDIDPYFARPKMEAKNPLEKIAGAIDRSIALFALITPNVVSDRHTRDWVVFELGFSKAKGIPIYCWIDREIKTKQSYPRLLDYITDYIEFDCQVTEEGIKITDFIRNKAFELLDSYKYNERVKKELIANSNKAKISENEIHSVEKADFTDENYSSKVSEKKFSLLMDVSNLADLNVDNKLLSKIYDSSFCLAERKYPDPVLTLLSILVVPFRGEQKVNISMNFYSKLVNKTCSFAFNEKSSTVEAYGSDKDERDNMDKIPLNSLPWQESPDWKTFYKIAVAKAGPLSFGSRSSYHLMAFPYSPNDLGKTGVFWRFSSEDAFSGKEHVIRWNGKTLNEDAIKQDF